MQARQMAAKECTSPLVQQIRTLEDQLASIGAEENAAKLVGDFREWREQARRRSPESRPRRLRAPARIRCQSSRDNSMRAHQVQRQSKTFWRNCSRCARNATAQAVSSHRS